MLRVSSSLVTDLSATSAALLGQVAWREQSSYELAKAMTGNLAFFWTRAESHVYRELKRLADDGLITAIAGSTGRRRRTSYRITAAGRRALRNWLAGPPGGVSMEHEPVLRVFLAPGGDRDDLLRAIAAAREQARAMLEIGERLAAGYLDGTHPFIEQVHLRALVWDYLWGWGQHTLAWADRAETEVRRWPDLTPAADKTERARRQVRSVLRRRPGR